MTYTWNVGGTSTTTTAPSLTTAALNATTTYSVSVKNANNCVSTAATGTITVNPYGQEWQAPGVCGCAPGLQNCSGTCQIYCGTTWTSCSGFTQVTADAYENGTTMNWNTANAYCGGLGAGWRLPSRTELQCMCKNKTSLPGGSTINIYWSGSVHSQEGHFLIVFSDCSLGNYADHMRIYVKCVK
jgi:hypothetical protein